MFGMSAADIIRIVLMGIFILVCIALSIVVLMQESKQQVCLVQSVEPLILTGQKQGPFNGRKTGIIYKDIRCCFLCSGSYIKY